jgi:hypothetical protein
VQCSSLPRVCQGKPSARKSQPSPRKSPQAVVKLGILFRVGRQKFIIYTLNIKITFHTKKLSYNKHNFDHKKM